jgi:menaquinone-dependent protoporphyrinogen oxidase
MKTLIAYAGKKGATEELARTIAAPLNGEADLVNLQKDAEPNPADYDCVIVGGAVFAGTVHKAVRSFCEKHEESLRSRRLALFLCSLREEEVENTFARSFPASLRSQAAQQSWLGGRIRFTDHNVIIRSMLKKIMGTADDVENMRWDAARQLASVAR